MIVRRLLLIGLLLSTFNLSAAEALVAPSGLTAAPYSTSEILLGWVGASQGWVSYSVERSLSATGGFVEIGGTGWASTGYMDVALAPATTYFYRVRVYYNGSFSGYSNVASATTFGAVTSTTLRTTTTTSTTSTTLAPPGSPVANAGPDQLTQTLTAVTFNGSGSSAPGGTIGSYAWAFGDGGTASGASVSHAYATPGTYTATLTVTDSRGLKASDSATVSVANRPPVANAGPDQTQAAGSAVTLNGTGSDPDGRIASYAWTFGDGASGSGAAMTHTYAAAGTYTATLTVTDDRGARGTDTAVVTVTSPVGAAPRWARRFGSLGNDFGRGVATDAGGNIVMAGRVEGATDLGGVICPDYSIFVAKYSAAGALQWAHCLSPAGGEGRAVAIDRSGNVVVTGNFGGTVDFGGGPVSSNGFQAIFIVRYSPSGAYLWSHVYGTNGPSSFRTSGNAVAVDGSGNVLVTGGFSDTIDLGGGPMTCTGNTSLFVAKFSAGNGAHLWSRWAGNTPGYSDAGNGVAVDSGGNVVVTGTFGGTADFGTGPVTANGLGIFIAKYSAAGLPLWTKATGGWLGNAGNAVGVDGADNVVVTGGFGAAIDLGTGPLMVGVETDVFLAKFTPAGAPLWAKKFGTGDKDSGTGLALDASGNIVISGSFGRSINLGGGNLWGQGASDIFLAKFSPAGDHLWSERLGGSSAEWPGAVAIGAGGAPVLTGTVSASVDFGAGPVPSQGFYDAFLLSRAP